MHGIKLVTFDATNTLLKFRVPPWQFYAIVAREHGFKGSPDDVKSRLKDSYKLMWEKYPNFGKNNINWEEWWRNVVKLTFKDQLPSNCDIEDIATKLINEFKTSRCWCPAQGGEKLLKLLRDKGACIGVISNFDPRLNDILTNVSLHNNFDFILTSYETGYSKPDKRIFKKAIEKCIKSVTPSESLHIGDDITKDYEGAKAAGWHALLIKENHTEKLPPVNSHVFRSLKDLSLAIEEKNLVL